MRKTSIIAALAAIIGMGGAALADGSRGKYVAPPAEPAAPSWTGFYLGGSAGALYGTGRVTDYEGIYDYGDFTKADTAFVYGVQAGYNLQRGMVVYGIEADISGSTFDTDRRFDGGDFINKISWDWFSTVRGRVGVTTGSSLFYVTGGVAFVNVNQKFGDLTDGGNVVKVDDVVTGFAAGAGLETMLSGPWSLKAEYLYIGLPDEKRVTKDYGYAADLSSDAHIVRLGLNYKLGTGCCDYMPLK